MVDFCTIYLDTAGDCGWCPPFGRSKVDWYVVAGLVVSPEKDHQAQIGIQNLLEKYISVKTRNESLIENYEIHYHDIIQGQNIYSSLKDTQKKQLSDEVFELLKEINPVLFATAINKKQLKSVYGSRAHDIRPLGLQSTIHRFAIYLRRLNKIGSIIVDEEEYKKDKQLQLMIHNFRREGITIRGSNYRPNLENYLEDILNNVSFTPSHLSAGLQLADVCSRTTWAHFERGKSDRFNEISHLWDNYGGRFYEPSIVPKIAM